MQKKESKVGALIGCEYSIEVESHVSSISVNQRRCEHHVTFVGRDPTNHAHLILCVDERLLFSYHV